MRNMSKSAAGTKEKPGRNVKQKSGLNRTILDQGWGEWRRQLEYKQDWRGGRVLAVPAHHTRQECPHCGHVAASNRQTHALFLCVQCGYSGNADDVASINILSRGIRFLRDEGRDMVDASTGVPQPGSPGWEVNGAVMP